MSIKPGLKTAGMVVAAVACVAFATYQVYSMTHPIKNGHIPKDFPNSYIAPADNGHMDKVVVWRGRLPPPMIEVDGIKRWEAYVCYSNTCPGAQGDVPYVFAHGYDPSANPGPSGLCPACVAGHARDSTKVKLYFNPEAQQRLVGVYESLR